MEDSKSCDNLWKNCEWRVLVNSCLLGSMMSMLSRVGLTSSLLRWPSDMIVGLGCLTWLCEAVQSWSTEARDMEGLWRAVYAPHPLNYFWRSALVKK